MPTADILEKGSIFFFYRPVVNEEEPEGLVDVQQFYVVLHADESDVYRVAPIGKKRLPGADEHEQFWGFVEAVVKDEDELEQILGRAEYDTKTGGRQVAPAARPAGEGKYALFRLDYDTRLSYVLELPDERSSVQEALNIQEEATYVVSVKNPTAGSPQGVGLQNNKKADFPQRLSDRFEGRRWIAIDPPDFLNYEGAEILLIGAFSEASDEAEDELSYEEKSRRTADVIKDLHIDREEHPLEPLFEGEWE